MSFDNTIIQAIKTHQRVIINYDSGKPNSAKEDRICEIYLYGLSKRSGMPMIRVFQPYGDTATRVPHWKTMRVDKIMNIRFIKDEYFIIPAGPTEGVQHFRIEGLDKLFIHVYTYARFDKRFYNPLKNIDRIVNIPAERFYMLTRDKDIINIEDIPTDYNDFATNEPKLHKTDTEIKLDNLRKQLENPKYLDLSKFNKHKEELKDIEKEIKNKPHLHKTDTEIKLDKLRKQLENPKYLDLSKFNKNNTDKVERYENNKANEPKLHKTDTEIKLDNLRKQLENPKYLDLSKFKK